MGYFSEIDIYDIDREEIINPEEEFSMLNSGNGFTYGEMRKGLEKGLCFKHPKWPAGQYIYKTDNKEYFEVFRFHNKFTELYPIGLYDLDDPCDFDVYEPFMVDYKRCNETVERLKERINNGEKLKRYNWTDSFIFLDKQSGHIIQYWKQPNRTYIERYEFGRLEDGLFETISADEFYRIVG